MLDGRLTAHDADAEVTSVELVAATEGAAI
jgi:hypothetical protein